MVLKVLEKGQLELEIRGRIEIFQTTAVLRTVRINRRWLKGWGGLMSFRLQWRTTNKCCYEKPSRSKVKLATVVEGDPKDPFSIVTTPRCRGRTTPFPELLHFTLDPCHIMPSVKQGGIKYHFKSLWYDSTLDWNLVSWTTGEHSTH